MLKFVVILLIINVLNCVKILAINYDNNIDNQINKIQNNLEKISYINHIADSLAPYSKEESLRLYDKSLLLAKKINFKEGICENHYLRGFLYNKYYDYHRAKQEFKKCIKLIESLKSYMGLSCLDNLGYIYYSLGYYDSSIVNYQQLLKIYLEMDDANKEISESYTKLGNTYLKLDKYYSAHEMYINSLVYAKKSRDKSLIADCYVNMGIVKSSLGDYSHAKNYGFKALKINKQIGDKLKIANNLANISKIYLIEKKYDSSLVFLYSGLDFLKGTDEKLLQANILADIGQIYAITNDYGKALKFATEAKAINLEINNLSGYYWDLLNIAQIYIAQKVKIETAKLYLDTVKNIALKSNLLSLLNSVYFVYSKYFYYIKNIDSVHYYWEKYGELQGTIYDNNIKSQITSLEDKFELERELSEQKVKQIEEERKNGIIITSLIAGAFALFLVAFVIWWERRKSEKLILNVLPKSIASRLKSKNKLIADSYDSASVVFIDIVQFTFLSKLAAPQRIVEVLNKLYTEFDHIAEKHGLEKIKTIGDCYMAAAGVPIKNDKHVLSAANFALESMSRLSGYDTGDGTKLQFRCGIDCGPVVAGVIGEKKFIYDLWGDAVNTASRMEEHGIVGKIQCTERFKNALMESVVLTNEYHFKFEERGDVEIKSKGLMKTFFLMNKEE